MYLQNRKRKIITVGIEISVSILAILFSFFTRRTASHEFFPVFMQFIFISQGWLGHICIKTKPKLHINWAFSVLEHSVHLKSDRIKSNGFLFIKKKKKRKLTFWTRLLKFERLTFIVFGRSYIISKLNNSEFQEGIRLTIDRGERFQHE